MSARVMPPFAAFGALLLSISCAASVAEKPTAAVAMSQLVAERCDIPVLPVDADGGTARRAEASTYPTLDTSPSGREYRRRSTSPVDVLHDIRRNAKGLRANDSVQ